MSLAYIHVDEKRSEKVILWSRIYLIAVLFQFIALALTTRSDSTTIPNIFSGITSILTIVGLIFLWQWTDSLYITARAIQPEGFGYRKGWTFWGWVIPIANLWIPKRIIDNSYRVIATSLGDTAPLKSRTWWILWIGASITSLFGFNGQAEVTSLNRSATLATVLLLTWAYSHWITIVKTVTKAQLDAVAKVNG